MITRSDDLSEEQRRQVREMNVESLAKYVFRYLRKILRTCFKKKDTIQELMFTFNHWSSPY